MSGLFKGRSSTITQDPMLTQEQLAAQKALMQLGETGSYGGINLGEAYQGDLGNFDMSAIEGLGQSNLMRLLQGNDTARNTIEGLAKTQFNPDDPSSGFAAYSRQVARATQGSRDAINRDAAVTGDRFSSRLGQQQADLTAQEGDILATKLADLYNTAQNRALTASTALEGIDQGRISSAYQYGGLERLLKNAEAQAKYNEFIRQRTEKLGQIDALQGVFNRNVGFGQMSKTTESPGIFSQMLGEVIPFIGSYNQAKYGADAAPGQLTIGETARALINGMTNGKVNLSQQTDAFGGTSSTSTHRSHERICGM